MTPFLFRCKRCLELVDPGERYQVRAHTDACGHRAFEPVPVDPISGRALEDHADGVMFYGPGHRIRRPGK